MQWQTTTTSEQIAEKVREQITALAKGTRK